MKSLKSELAWWCFAAVFWPAAKLFELSWTFSHWRGKRSRPREVHKNATLDQGQLLTLLKDRK